MTTLIFLIISCSNNNRLREKYSNKNYESANVISTDISNFYVGLDKLENEETINIFVNEYFGNGSNGLKDFRKLRLGNKNKFATYVFENKPKYYDKKEELLNLNSELKELKFYFKEMSILYPKAIYPNIYLLVGKFTTGGTISTKGLLIGSEMFDPKEVPIVIIHELIHYQQSYYYNKNESLLSRCIKEGSADFICELITGSHPNKEIYVYGDKNELELKKEFLNEYRGKTYSKWLYGNSESERPKDLGYWIGYKIVKAYYDKNENKLKAIDDILNIKDFEVFLNKSNYLNKG